MNGTVMNLYHVIYATSSNNTAEMFVVASTSTNAWTAVQAADASATTIETMDEQIQGITVGS